MCVCSTHNVDARLDTACHMKRPALGRPPPALDLLPVELPPPAIGNPPPLSLPFERQHEEAVVLTGLWASGVDFSAPHCESERYYRLVILLRRRHGSPNISIVFPGRVECDCDFLVFANKGNCREHGLGGDLAGATALCVVVEEALERGSEVLPISRERERAPMRVKDHVHYVAGLASGLPVRKLLITPVRSRLRSVQDLTRPTYERVAGVVPSNRCLKRLCVPHRRDHPNADRVGILP
mmetsp:Transcript_17891/g.43781  ORF Transcript_17891/g.43781 Transcript_17891/m.43781 type:complete len:239 (-) Transcript_17891:190-906(-)